MTGLAGWEMDLEGGKKAGMKLDGTGRLVGKGGWLGWGLVLPGSMLGPLPIVTSVPLVRVPNPLACAYS